MKFTYPQKKWVLTSALLAVLGFNVSFNTHNDGIASADFASTSGDLTESKVYTAEGVMPVKYIDNGDEEVLALVPKRTTEGKVCEGKCGYDTIVLSAKNKSDIDALNVELMKKLAEQPAAAKKKVAKEEVAEADAEATGEEEVVAKKKVSPLDRIMKRDCSTEYNEAATLSCAKNKFVEALKDSKKSKDISAEDALEFYKKEIQPRLVAQLSEARRITSAQRRAATNPSAWQSYRASEDFDRSPTDIHEMINSSLAVVEDLIIKVPSKYEAVRSRVILAETEILKFEAQQIKAQESAKNYPEAGAKLHETTLLKEAMYALTQQSLRTALSNDTITDVQSNAYNRFMDEFYKNINTLLGPNGQLPTGTSTIDPSINLSPRLQNPGRISGTTSTIGTLPTTPTTPGTIPSGVSSRTGATLSTQSQSQLSVHPNSGGVTFGTPRDATAEALQQRALIRGRQ
ncbi:hypothetical protein AB1A81_15340 [Bdellovibrio bacteriovorus]|uniref:Uncharacterized protein n=1 Tax=Bdellovibrio bacteriovorus (strain ATCC 15356 / DSM 50701 / NCIMB 9529 / HD100) TaxID=264462 RepID=Q6MI31_BDEBA|nr:hypothetical protein [Bdellovibrio bacteriovorus]CAE78151.1 hypothetical protein predicted by Glimmer/Critica [Bdellovibrio bacteriovorus HD100]